MVRHIVLLGRVKRVQIRKWCVIANECATDKPRYIATLN